MKLQFKTPIAVLIPAILAGSAAAQTISICPGPAANVPRIYMPGPRIAPYAPMPEVMPVMPAPRAMPLVPRILPIMPEPRAVPVAPMPKIMPILPALSVRLAAPAKDAASESAGRELERLFDGRPAPAVKTPVEQPAEKNPAIAPSRRIGIPEQDLEREIGVP